MTMVGEEAVEVDFERAAIGFLKADGFKETLVLLVDDFSAIDCVMHTAKVDEVERASAENEECLKIVRIDGGSNIKNESALCGKLELRNTAKLVVNCCRICEQVGIKGNVASLADFLLLGFGLNG